MTILNDMEIRQRCMVPTHQSRWADGEKYTKFDKTLYNFNTGAKDYCGNLKELTEVSVPYPRMITPFVPGQVRVDAEGKKIVSYGTSSMGYDVRLANKFKIFTNIDNAIVDPLNMPETSYVDREGDSVIIPPNSYILGHTIETFNIPRDIMVVCVGKSTYARVGCAVNVTPIEPGFSGQVVIEVSNLTPLPLKVYSGQGIAQFLFLKGNPCETSYADRMGKYQNQSGVQTALV